MQKFSTIIFSLVFFLILPTAYADIPKGDITVRLVPVTGLSKQCPEQRLGRRNRQALLGAMLTGDGTEAIARRVDADVYQDTLAREAEMRESLKSKLNNLVA